ncbi:unnamed protein product [Toxocara canis]|uniref:Col_cuticle_N domain-containing protein n=1 Tax=Toxocara canis TaxID=6265 RepID=A0A183ULS7_TOXCA|nr:unnamed protein product [Toxocara canis]
MRDVFVWNIVCAASLSCVALSALLISLPLLFNEISSIEEQLQIERYRYTEFSNSLWKSLINQSAEIRGVGQLRRRRQYEYGAQRSKVAGYEEGSKKRKECPAGRSGKPGYPGIKGPDAVDGIPGRPGKNGEEYPIIGARAECSPCPPGQAGLVGYKGKRGPKGPPGIKGGIGSPGLSGQLGDVGEDGDYGPEGEQGLAGQKGAPGRGGAAYGRGPRGPKGELGDVGEAGYAGAKGDRGDTGPRGIMFLNSTIRNEREWNIEVHKRVGPALVPSEHRTFNSIYIHDPDLEETKESKEERVTRVNKADEDEKDRKEIQEEEVIGADGEYCPCPARPINTPGGGAGEYGSQLPQSGVGYGGYGQREQKKPPSVRPKSAPRTDSYGGENSYTVRVTNGNGRMENGRGRKPSEGNSGYGGVTNGYGEGGGLQVANPSGNGYGGGGLQVANPSGNGYGEEDGSRGRGENGNYRRGSEAGNSRGKDVYGEDSGILPKASNGHYEYLSKPGIGRYTEGGNVNKGADYYGADDTEQTNGEARGGYGQEAEVLIKNKDGSYGEESGIVPNESNIHYGEYNKLAIVGSKNGYDAEIVLKTKGKNDGYVSSNKDSSDELLDAKHSEGRGRIDDDEPRLAIQDEP